LKLERYVAFLRGVSPLNAKMPELKRAFERAGFQDVKTLLSSGNVVFSAPRGSVASLQKRSERAMQQQLGRSFQTFVRSVSSLERLLRSDPYASFQLKRGSKRVITFLLGKPKAAPKLPLRLHDARILHLQGREVFSVYVPGPRGPVFMNLLERTFGKAITTRTWETVSKATRSAV
jgi:uncharacterized protein (DUF1697 family)